MTKSSGGDATRSDQVVELDSALWRRLLSSDEEEAFFESWLALQARQLPNATNAVLLTIGEEGRLKPSSYWPKGASPGVEAIKAAQSAVKRKMGVVRKAPARGNEHSFAYPVLMHDEIVAVGAFTVADGSDVDLQSALRRVQWGSAWIEQYYAASRRDTVTESAERLVTALDLVAMSLEHESVGAGGLAAMSELAVKTGAARATIGTRKISQSKILAVSHTSQISRRQNLARAICAAMDEAIDQQRVIVWPTEADEHIVAVKHRELSLKHGAGGSVVTVPLNDEQKALGAICVEFQPDQPVKPEDVDMIETVGSALLQVMALRVRDERWLPTKIAATLWGQLGKLLGRGYLGRKLVLLALAGICTFFYYFHVDFRVPARATLEGAIQRVVSSPIDGYIAEDFARPGDVVAEGELLARLDDRELQLELAAWQNRRAQYEAERHNALAEHSIAQAQVFQAQIAEADVQLELVRQRIEQTEIRAPFDGRILSGDLSQGLGSGVRLGDPLFQVAPLAAYRVVLNVDEEDITRLEVGQEGELLLASRPDRPLAFEVSRLTAVTTPEAGRNYFRVEALLDVAPPNLRPGMQGTARVSVGEERLIWIWTRRAVNWARVTIWKWRP